MNPLDRFIGAEQILKETPDLKVITDHLRQYPLIAIFAAALYKSTPDSVAALTIWGACAFILTLLSFMIMTQGAYIAVSLIGGITSLKSRTGAPKAIIFILTIMLGYALMASLVVFLIKIIPTM